MGESPPAPWAVWHCTHMSIIIIKFEIGLPKIQFYRSKISDISNWSISVIIDAREISSFIAPSPWLAERSHVTLGDACWWHHPPLRVVTRRCLGHAHLIIIHDSYPFMELWISGTPPVFPYMDTLVSVFNVCTTIYGHISFRLSIFTHPYMDML